MDSKPILHVEVHVKNARGGFVRTDTIRKEVTGWLEVNKLHLRIGEEVEREEIDDLAHGKSIESIRIADFSGPENDTGVYRVEDIQLNVCAYLLQDDHVATRRSKRGSTGESEDDGGALRSLKLPSKDLVGSWEGLVFEDGIPNRLLRFASGMIEMMCNSSLDKTKVNWNKLILLHGPPGSGKTSLCRALAQKLTIRLSQHFTRGKLIELSTHALLSKWFGESGKLVSKTFDDIVSIALEEDEANLVCVLIDEVETLTGNRSSQGEVGDALRATNQLLTALDKLRYRPNVIVLCTSNLLNVIDPAFLDRADIKQALPNPSASAAFEILRSTLNELLRSGIISPPVHEVILLGSDGIETEEAAREIVTSALEEGPYLLPNLAETRIRYDGMPFSPPQKLWAFAQRCDDMSGRMLRRLPLKALAMYAYSTPYSMNDALQALRLAVEETLKGH